MGFGNIGATQLLILLAIVILVFGTKRVRNIGSDLGSAIRGFRKGVSGDDEKPESAPEQLGESPESTTSETRSHAESNK